MTGAALATPIVRLVPRHPDVTLAALLERAGTQLGVVVAPRGLELPVRRLVLDPSCEALRRGDVVVVTSAALAMLAGAIALAGAAHAAAVITADAAAWSQGVGLARRAQVALLVTGDPADAVAAVHAALGGRTRASLPAAAVSPQQHADRLMLQRLGELMRAAGIPECPAVQTLADYDRAHGTDYLCTLIAYLGANCSVPRTARRLHLHRNTVHYRIRRLAEIADLSLDDPDARLAVELHLRVRTSPRPG